MKTSIPRGSSAAFITTFIAAFSALLCSSAVMAQSFTLQPCSSANPQVGIHSAVVVATSNSKTLKITGRCDPGAGKSKLYISQNSNGTPYTLLNQGGGTCSGNNAGVVKTVTMPISQAPGSYYLFFKQGSTVTPHCSPIVIP
ncbi:MAG: hypothetical protein HC765_14895 [Brachymonas sp.]|nr:hypothetical protein [Brachymonas sp.]